MGIFKKAPFLIWHFNYFIFSYPSQNPEPQFSQMYKGSTVFLAGFRGLKICKTTANYRNKNSMVLAKGESHRPMESRAQK